MLGYIVRDGRVLLIKRGFPPYRGFWSLPGGGTKRDEDLREACVREVKEETGLDVEALAIMGNVRSAPIFSCKIIAGEPKAQPPETTEIAWVPLDAYKAVQFVVRVPDFIRNFLEEMTK